MRRLTSCLAAAIAGLMLLACSEQVVDEPPAEAAPPADASAEAPDGVPAELEGDLPPVDPLALEPLYGEALAVRGVELTDRGGLIDRVDGYQVSEDGTHLALYVGPIAERTDDEYVDGIVELAQLFLPEVFDRWPGLESFDICQELPEDEETGYVLPVTQIDIGRSTAAEIDWNTAELTDLFRGSEADETFVLEVRGDLRLHPQVVAAQREARDDEGSGWRS